MPISDWDCFASHTSFVCFDINSGVYACVCVCVFACVCLSVCARETCVCVIAVVKVAFFDISQNFYFNFIPLLQCLFLQRGGEVLLSCLVFMRYAQVVTWSTSVYRDWSRLGGRICGVEKNRFWFKPN